MHSLSSQPCFETPPLPGEAGAGDREEVSEDEGFGDFGDSLLRRLCLDAVAVGEYAPFGKVRETFVGTFRRERTDLPELQLCPPFTSPRTWISQAVGIWLALRACYHTLEVNLYVVVGTYFVSCVSIILLNLKPTPTSLVVVQGEVLGPSSIRLVSTTHCQTIYT